MALLTVGIGGSSYKRGNN